MPQSLEEIIDKQLKEFGKIAKHDEDYLCNAHSEGQECCLDEERNKHQELKAFLSSAITQAYSTAIDDAIKALPETTFPNQNDYRSRVITNLERLKK